MRRSLPGAGAARRSRAQARGGLEAAAAFLELGRPRLPLTRCGGRSGRWPRRGPRTRLARSMPPWPCWAPQRPGRRDQRPGARGRDRLRGQIRRSPPAAAATHPRCCSRQRGSSSRSDPHGWPARRTLDALAAAIAAAKPAGSRRRDARGRRGGACGGAAPRPPPRARSAAGWPSAPGHGRLPGGESPVLRQAVSAFRGTDISTEEGAALALAGQPCRGDCVGLRQLGRAGRPPGRARP